MVRQRPELSGNEVKGGDRPSEPKRLRDDARITLDEARMVLPGIQALFGFQLIAVFSDGFRRLADTEQLAHLVSLLLVTASIALIMTPAAYDRIVDEPVISRRFIKLASRVITTAMVPLMLGIAIEIYVVTSLVIDARATAAATALLVALLFGALWFAFPWLRRARSAQ
jgi:uncharacterized protein DUF6328